MAGASELCNGEYGERVVVFLFVSRVLFFAAAASLPCEALALVLLATAGLYTEISVESSGDLGRLKTRPGASGILLGTITLPTVMLSRLIQFSRALPRQDVVPQEFAYLSMQYWAISSSCFGVLIFFCLVRQHLPKSTSSSQCRGSQASKFSLLYIIIYTLVCYWSFATKSYSGEHIVMNLFWLLCHGIATVVLIQYILNTFPACASVGESLLVSSGLVLFFGDMLGRTVSKINLFSSWTKLTIAEDGGKSEINTVIQGVLLGLLLLPAFYKTVLHIWICITSWNKTEAQAAEGRAFRWLESAIVFYASLLVVMTMISPTWMLLIQDFHVHPLLWVFIFVFSEPFKRLALCIYWICVICASVLRFYNISKHSKVERILLRKYYHLVAVLMFSPALLFQPTFLDLAFGAALAVFLVLEMIRVWKIWPLGHIVHQFMNAFTDHRDSEILIVSHFSLLLGCAIPKWLSSGISDRPLAPFAGILSLGIGDTMASMVGHKYGVIRWSKTGKKTIEGTFAGVAAVLIACSILEPYLASTGFILSEHWLSLLIAVTLTGLLEAHTAQLDNAFIPLVFYSLLCL